MIVGASLDARLEDLRRRLRALEHGIRHLQARLAAWDLDETKRTARERARSAAAIARAVVEP